MLSNPRRALTTLALLCISCQGVCEQSGTYKLQDLSSPSSDMYDMGQHPADDMRAKDVPDLDMMTAPPGCGDGTRQDPEQCDEGTQNSDAPNARCRLNCTLARCGDGIVDSLLEEQCDDKNSDDEDNCLTSCKYNVCGDGIINKSIDPQTQLPNETCDDKDEDDTNACTNYCTTCGNGFIDVDAGEECDGGESPAQNNDTCDRSCKREPMTVCAPNSPQLCQLALSSPDQEAPLNGPIALWHDGQGDFTVSAVSNDFNRVYLFRGTPEKSLYFEQSLERSNNGWSAFGRSIALAKDRLMVGALESDKGIVVEYLRDETGRWVQHKVHRAPIPQDGDLFGAKLWLDEAWWVVGAPGEDASKGAIYIYRRDAAEWTLDQRIASPSTSGTGFGNIFDFNGGWLWTSELSGDTKSFLYKRDGTWRIAKEFDAKLECSRTNLAGLKGALSSSRLIASGEPCKDAGGVPRTYYKFWSLAALTQPEDTWTAAKSLASRDFLLNDDDLVTYNGAECIESAWDISAGLDNAKDLSGFDLLGRPQSAYFCSRAVESAGLYVFSDQGDMRLVFR